MDLSPDCQSPVMWSGHAGFQGIWGPALHMLKHSSYNPKVALGGAPVARLIWKQFLNFSFGSTNVELKYICMRKSFASCDTLYISTWKNSESHLFKKVNICCFPLTTSNCYIFLNAVLLKVLGLYLLLHCMKKNYVGDISPLPWSSKGISSTIYILYLRLPKMCSLNLVMFHPDVF